MKVQNSIVARQNSKPSSFTAFINSDAVKRGIIDRLGGDVQMAARLISTINSTVSASEKLQECDYGSIVTAALHGEIGMNLSLALGQYGIIPYGKKASYQLQVNGLQQLCIRSKAYSKVKVYEVREGEFVGRDPMTRDPIFKWLDDEDKRLELPIVGYYAFYQLSSEFNNFFNCLYWSHEKILRHADRYSAGFNLETYRKLLAGELSPAEVEKLQGTKNKKGSSPWYANPDDDPHIKMCKKTVLKQLLNDGFAPKSIQEVIIEDNYAESHGGDIIHEDDAFFVDNSTGEVIESTATAADAPQEEKTAKGTRKSKSVENGEVSARESENTTPSGNSDFFDD